MVNINKNSYFALKVPFGSHAESKPVTGFSLSGANSFSVSINFYTDHIDHKVSLLKQDGAIDIGIDNGSLYYTSEVLGTFSANITILEKIWNVFDIVYDKSEIFFYLNGFLCFQDKVTVPAECPISTKNYIIGEDLDGYLQFLKIFNYALTQTEITQNQYQNNIPMEKTELYFDFSTFKAKDKGKNNITILYDSNCNTKNIVKTISFNESGFAVPLESDHVNPGGFSSGEYTILSKVYVWPSMKKRTVVLTNGSMDSGNSVTLGIINDWDTEQSKLFLNMGKDTLVSTLEVPVYQWVDIACSYSSVNNKVKLYIDGIIALEQSLTETFNPLTKGNVIIGNTLSEGRLQQGTAFNGYVDSISIFDKALSEVKLQAFVDTSPFVYDDNIIALYNFNTEDACDSISKALVALSSGAIISISENTVYNDTIPELNYSCTDIAKQYSDFEVWQANVIGFAFTEFVAAETGIAATTGFLNITTKEALTSRVSELIIKEILPLKEAQNVISSYQAIPTDTMMDFLIKLQSKGWLDKLVKTFYSKALSFIPASITTALMAALSSSAAAYINEFIAAILLVSVIAKITQRTHINPPPSPKPPDDPDSKYRILRVDAITFNHNKDDYIISATNIRKNSKEEIPIPEWVYTVNNNSENGSQAAYIKSKVGDPFIKVKFYYGTNYTDVFKTEISGKCTGDNILGNIPVVKATFTTSGYYDIDFKISNNNFSAKDIGSYKDQINWIGDSGFIGTSYHNVHIIKDVPIEPWSIKAEDVIKYPTVEALEFCADAFKKNLIICKNFIDFEELQDIAKKITVNMFQSQKFEYNTVGAGEPVYSLFDDDDDLLKFHRSKFLTDYGKATTTAKVLVNCLDCALIISDNCGLQGYKLKIVGVKSALPEIWNEEFKEFFPAPLELQQVKLIGSSVFEVLEDIDCHYFAAEVTGEDNNEILVYDGCLIGKAIEENTEIIAVNLAFSKYTNEIVGAKTNQYYRETFFAEGSSCKIKEINYSWEAV